MYKNRVLFFVSFLFSIGVSGLNPSHFTIQRITAPYFIVDGNAPTTVTRCYVGFEVVNKSNSATTYSNLSFSILNINSSVPGQNYSILAPLSGKINVGTLRPGESKVCYYYVQYPANTSPVATFNTELKDATVTGLTQSFSIYNRSSISANAGGISQSSLNNQDLVGGLVTDTVTYTVGNVRNGDEADFQIASTPNFDPTKLQLVETKIVQSSVPGIRNGTTDSLYFITGNGGVGSTIKVLWKFRIVDFGFTTYILPLSGATSGSTNYKYAINSAYGIGIPVTIAASSNKLSISKNADADVYCATNQSVALFTIRIQNAGAFDVAVNSIQDTLPTGFSFIGVHPTSQITFDNSTSLPSSGSTTAIRFEGNGNGYTIPAGGELLLVYEAAVPSSSDGILVTGASALVGENPVSSAKDTLTISCTLPVKLLSFKAEKQNQDIQISWSTLEEIQSKSFQVMYSQDGRNWNVITEIAAAGNANTIKHYSHLHKKPTGQLHFYQLKEISMNGSYSTSRIERIAFDNRNELRVYPTLIQNNQVNIVLQSPMQLSILDMSGKIVVQKQLSGGHHMLELKGLAKGIYLIRTPVGSQRIVL